MDASAPQTPPRRRYRALLVIVLALGALLGWLGRNLQRASQNRQDLAELSRVADSLRSLGAAVRVQTDDRMRLNQAFADPGRHWIAVVDFNSPRHQPDSPNSVALPRRNVTDATVIQMLRVSSNRLTRLQSLSLSNTRISDASLAYLNRLKCLEEIYLADT